MQTVFLIYTSLGLILLMGALARSAGSGVSDLGKSTAILFGWVFGWASLLVGVLPYYAPLWGLAAWLASETGHGRFYYMKGANINDPNPERIERWLVMWWYPGDITKPLYSWVCMGFKGLLIGAAVFPFGLALGILQPLAYYIGFHVVPRYIDDPHHEAPEWCAGSAAGAVIAAALIWWAL